MIDRRQRRSLAVPRPCNGRPAARDIVDRFHDDLVAVDPRPMTKSCSSTTNISLCLENCARQQHSYWGSDRISK